MSVPHFSQKEYHKTTVSCALSSLSPVTRNPWLTDCWSIKLETCSNNDGCVLRGINFFFYYNRCIVAEKQHGIISSIQRLQWSETQQTQISLSTTWPEIPGQHSGIRRKGKKAGRLCLMLAKRPAWGNFNFLLTLLIQTAFHSLLCVFYLLEPFWATFVVFCLQFACKWF